MLGYMVLYTKAVITTTSTTTTIINTKRTEPKKFPNILSFRRSIPFQSVPFLRDFT